MDSLKQKWQSEEYIVHSFLMSDVDDPDVWAAQSLYDFEHTEKGEWVMRNSNPLPTWNRVQHGYGWQYMIHAYMTPEQITYFKLKYE